VDALASVLAVAGVRGTVAGAVNAAEPWGLLVDDIPGASFHAVTAGTAWLCVPGRADTHLMPGDVALLPAGPDHVLVSAPGVATVSIDDLAAEQHQGLGGQLQLGTGPPQTRILCARYQQDPAITLPLLSLLPEVLYVPAARAGDPLDTTLRLLGQELSQRQPGLAAVLNRIVDILFVQLLRAWLDTDPAQAPPACWLGALTDPVAGPALAALHGDPGRDWSAASLAASIGVSRATLGRRFLARVGDTPAGYLTRWRMDLAAQRLRDTDDTVGVIARSLGYTSEYAFNRAFARARGTPPGRYRARSRLLFADGHVAGRPGRDRAGPGDARGDDHGDERQQDDH
jgi:AraC-like DNA-binding protein